MVRSGSLEVILLYSKVCKIVYILFNHHLSSFLKPTLYKIWENTIMSYTGEYRSVKTRILAYFMLCKLLFFLVQSSHFGKDY